jgi:hypothetical protein
MPTDMETLAFVVRHWQLISDRSYGPWQYSIRAPSGNLKRSFRPRAALSRAPAPVPRPRPRPQASPFETATFRSMLPLPFYCPLSLFPRPLLAQRVLVVRLSGSGAGCFQNPVWRNMDRGVAALGDCKRWTGGRSRTLAPPRGAAWISQTLVCVV